MDSGTVADTSSSVTDTGSTVTDTGSTVTDTGAAADTGSTVTDTGAGADSAITCNGTPTTHDVQVGGVSFSFTPSTLTICAGDTVHWVWMGSGHTVTSGTNGTADNKFCNQNNMNCSANPTESTGNTYDFTFATAGTFPYFCRPHASLGMTGTITVQ
jgi:plastocyanin